MKTIKTLLVVMLVSTFVGVNGQTLSAKEQERENNEIALFSDEEINDIQIWFYQEVQDMDMDEETLAQYESNLVVYTSRMMRLDDKDKDYTKKEILIEFELLLTELNQKMKSILPKDQFKIHEFNFRVLANYVEVKMNV